MNTLKAIVESGMVPNEQGTPVPPADGYVIPSDALYNAAEKIYEHGQTSKQYTPSGEFDRKAEPFYLGFRFWLLCAVVFGLSVLAGQFAMQWALGAC